MPASARALQERVSTESYVDNATACAFGELASRRLAENCPYAYYFRDVTIHFSSGILTLKGRVASFYLKQVLNSFLMRLGGVERLDDQVDVVSSTGLSSVRFH